jgi:hypothetical protein
MAKQTENIIKIIEAGSNVIVSSVSGKRKELLIQIAQAAVANRPKSKSGYGCLLCVNDCARSYTASTGPSLAVC